MAKVGLVFVNALSPSHFVDEMVILSLNAENNTIMPRDIKPETLYPVQVWIGEMLNHLSQGKEVMLYGQEWIDIHVKMDDGVSHRLRTNRPFNHASYAIPTKTIFVIGEIAGLMQGLGALFSQIQPVL